LSELRKEWKHLHANLIDLFRSKMLSEEALRTESTIVVTSMRSSQPGNYGTINQTIDHLHSNVTEMTSTSNTTSSLPTVTSLPARSKGGWDGQHVYESQCPVCGQIGFMCYDKSISGQQDISDRQPFAVTEEEHNFGLGIKSWPDELDMKAFYERVTGNEAKEVFNEV
jgi:hypothetical protein